MDIVDPRAILMLLRKEERIHSAEAVLGLV